MDSDPDPSPSPSVSTSQLHLDKPKRQLHKSSVRKMETDTTRFLHIIHSTQPLQQRCLHRGCSPLGGTVQPAPRFTCFFSDLSRPSVHLFVVLTTQVGVESRAHWSLFGLRSPYPFYPLLSFDGSAFALSCIREKRCTKCLHRKALLPALTAHGSRLERVCRTHMQMPKSNSVSSGRIFKRS